MAETSRVAIARVDDSPISVDDCERAVQSDAAGAVVTFAGVVRNHDDGREVAWLDYAGHPTAAAVIEQVATDVAALFPEVQVAVLHRVGRLAIGDVALACAVASAHRQDAFAACSQLVDEVKKRVPIWKEQGFGNGSTEWVASLG